jgi:hypothetical protein
MGGNFRSVATKINDQLYIFLRLLLSKKNHFKIFTGTSWPLHGHQFFTATYFFLRLATLVQLLMARAVGTS